MLSELRLRVELNQYETDGIQVWSEGRFIISTATGQEVACMDVKHRQTDAIVRELAKVTTS